MITLTTQPGGCVLAHSSRQNDAPTSSVVKYNGRGIATLPNEMFDNILSYLNPQDVSNCRCVSQRWKKAIDDYQIMPHALYAFYRRCHPQKHSPNPYTVELYDLSIKGWLNKFSGKGKKLRMQLNQQLKNKLFPQIVCWSIAQVLGRTKAFSCESILTIEHSDWMISACFSADGKHLVTASHDCTAKIYGVSDGQWQEKATIEHSDIVLNACFSADGKHLVIASRDQTAKIYGISDGQWQKKATIKHRGGVNRACFSVDGKHLVTASDDHTAKIWGLNDREWREKATIKHDGSVKSACFSPDGKYVMTVSKVFGTNSNFVANVYMLIDKASKGIS